MADGKPAAYVSTPSSTWNIKQAILIVFVCSLVYFLISFAIILYCKRRRSKAKNNSNSSVSTAKKPIIRQQESIKSNSTIDKIGSGKITQPLLTDKDSLNLTIPKDGNYSIAIAPPYRSNSFEVRSQRETPNSRRSFQRSKSNDYEPTPTVHPAYPMTTYDRSKQEYVQSLNTFKLVGRCAYGPVYLAKSDLGTPRIAALKMLRINEASDEFKREYEIYQQLSHENIVRLIDICAENINSLRPTVLIYEYSECVSHNFINKIKEFEKNFYFLFIFILFINREILKSF